MAHARPAQIDSSKVLLSEREAMNRYLAWQEHRERELVAARRVDRHFQIRLVRKVRPREHYDGGEGLLTFAQWLGQSRIEILPREW
jgi:hypothetical protein